MKANTRAHLTSYNMSILLVESIFSPPPLPLPNSPPHHSQKALSSSSSSSKMALSSSFSSSSSSSLSAASPSSSAAGLEREGGRGGEGRIAFFTLEGSVLRCLPPKRFFLIALGHLLLIRQEGVVQNQKSTTAVRSGRCFYSEPLSRKSRKVTHFPV